MRMTHHSPRRDLSARPETPGAGTLLLTKSDIAALASLGDYAAAAETGFRAYAAGAVATPAPMEISGVGGAFHAKGASMNAGGRPLAALKLNANYPANRARFGLPTIQGAILLCDAETGVILAILESSEITLRRTAAASAIAMKVLARHDAETLLICGCGVQGRAHAEALTSVRAFKRIQAFDKNADAARAFCVAMSAQLRAEVEPAADFGMAARDSDIVVLATPAQRPILQREHLRAGGFIAAIGADNASKNEVAPDAIAAGVVVTDVTDQCALIGDLRAAIAAGAMTREAVRAELGDCLSGARPGRLGEDETLIFDSTGAAFQDLAAAALIYDRARAAGAGSLADLRR